MKLMEGSEKSFDFNARNILFLKNLDIIDI